MFYAFHSQEWGEAVSVVTLYELQAALCARVWPRPLNGAAEEEEDGNMYKVRIKNFSWSFSVCVRD